MVLKENITVPVVKLNLPKRTPAKIWVPKTVATVAALRLISKSAKKKGETNDNE